MNKLIKMILLLLLIAVPASAADDITVYDYNRNTKVLKAKDIGGVLHPGRILYAEDGTPIYTENGVLAVDPHTHSSHGTVHFHVTNITTDYRCILIDLSDTTNWPHSDTDVIHIEYIDAQVDSDTNGQYDIGFYFLEDCDATDCRSVMFWSASGSKSTGNNLEAQIVWDRNGPVLKTGAGGVISSMRNDADTNYQTDVNLCTILSPGAATTPPGNGDAIIEVDWQAGSFDLDFNVSYHTHPVGHP